MAIRNNARKHVRVLTGRDITALEGLGRVGVATKQQLMTHCTLRPERLAKLCHSKYLTAHNQLVAGAGLVTVYKLASKGEDWLRERGFRHIKHNHPAEINHDLKLTEVYFKCDDKVRAAWYSDKAAQEILNLAHTAGRQNFPDAVIIIPQSERSPAVQVEGVPYFTVSIEVIGSSYTKNLIAAKKEYAEQHFDKYLFY